jgi:hypothetical protein
LGFNAAMRTCVAQQKFERALNGVGIEIEGAPLL